MRTLVRIAVTSAAALAVLALGAGPAAAAAPGHPEAQLGVATAASVAPGADLPPGLAHSLGVLAAVPAVQRPPNPCLSPGFGVLTAPCDV